MTKITFRGYNRVKFQSLKLGKTIFCQSLLLRDYLLHLEWDDNVQSYELKPFRISYKNEGRPKTIHPHALVNVTDQKPIIVWLKSSATNDESLDQTVNLLTNFCETKGFRFQVIFMNEIRKEPLLSNLKLLRRYTRCEINFNQTRLCREFFESFPSPLLGAFSQFLEEKNAPPELAFAFLAQKIIETDIDSIFVDQESPIQLKKQFPNFHNGRITI